MIVFKQKEYTEYDAMRYLYTELRKFYDKSKIDTINSSQLIPVLKGNNIVVEKFVISHNLIGKDTYRMYIRIGAKAKLPDGVRLPGYTREKSLGSLSMKFKHGLQRLNSDINDENRQKLFGKNNNNKKNNNNNNGGSGGGDTPVNFEFSPFIDLKRTVDEQTGETILFDKSQRLLVIEYKSIQDAIRSLNILPFGLNYKIYLLDA